MKNPNRIGANRRASVTLVTGTDCRAAITVSTLTDQRIFMEIETEMQDGIKTAPQNGHRQERRGIILVLSAMLMVVVMGFAAFTVDVGFMVLTVDELQNAADAAALAGAMRLNQGARQVRDEAKDTALKNFTRKQAVALSDSDIEVGTYDLVSKLFTSNEATPNAVRVTARALNRKLFFAPVLGKKTFTTSAQSIAMINPRDIAFVVDLSGSMNDDTEAAWANETINLEWASAGYPTIGTTLISNLYSDLNFGSYPGSSQWIGQPAGIANNTSCYYNLQVYGGPLSASSINSKYKILSGDSVTTRKTKTYKWIIDQQLAGLMPNAHPYPDSSNATSLSYWTAYLDYVIASKTVSQTTYPPNQDADRMSGFNNPNGDTHPTTASNLPDKYLNFVGYRTYVQFLLDFGRDRTPDVANGTNASMSYTKTELSRFNTQWCRYVNEITPAGTFSFPPRTQPVHACRRALIAALKVLEDQNAGIQDAWRDHVSIVTFDAVDTYHQPALEQPLTADYRAAMNICTKFQAVGDLNASTATENGLIVARNHLKLQSQGGQGRVFSNKVVILLTDGVPNIYQSSYNTVSSYITSNPSSQYYANSSVNMPWNSVLMQSAQMKEDRTQIFPIGTGLGADYEFMDRAAMLNGTAKNGKAPRGTGNPAVYEQVLTDIFTDIIKGGRVRLVR